MKLTWKGNDAMLIEFNKTDDSWLKRFVIQQIESLMSLAIYLTEKDKK